MGLEREARSVSCIPCVRLAPRYYCITELVEQLEQQIERLRDDYHKICRVPVITSLEEETRIVSTSTKVCLVFWCRSGFNSSCNVNHN